MKAFHMSILKEPFMGLVPVLTGMFSARILLSLFSSFFIQNNLKKGLFK
jgi:hypothetical protein